MGERQVVLVGTRNTGSRRSLRMALESRDLMCTEAVDAAHAILLARMHHPAVALLDIDFGLHITVQMLEEQPSVRVIVLGDDDPRDELWASMRAGASGYLPRDMSPEAVVASTLGVLAGEAAVPRVLMRRLIADFRKIAPIHDTNSVDGNELTAREHDVLNLLVQGRTTAEIGAALYIAKVTVRSHIASILRKLGCEDRAGAVEAALAKQLCRADTPGVACVTPLVTAVS
jgi:DNA-binding NarL/FixJ family response regulator